MSARTRAIVLSLLVIISSDHAWATEPPSGTVSCFSAGEILFNPGLPFLPSSSRPAIKMNLKAPTPVGECDVSGVTGGRLPISSADVRFTGRMPAGTTCWDWVNTPTFERTKVKVKWRGTRNGHSANVGASSAYVASATWESIWLTVVTEPIARGAFAGSTLTLKLPTNDEAAYNDTCANLDGSYGNLTFGAGNPVRVTVP